MGRITKIISVSLFCFVAVLFTSCDCLQHIQGVVVDSETQLPIEGVMVRTDFVVDSVARIQTDSIMPNNAYGIDWDSGVNGKYTDSSGNFEFTYMTGCIFVRPKIPLIFEKEGYNVLRKKFKGYNVDTVIVVLKKKME